MCLPCICSPFQQQLSLSCLFTRASYCVLFNKNPSLGLTERSGIFGISLDARQSRQRLKTHGTGGEQYEKISVHTFSVRFRFVFAFFLSLGELCCVCVCACACGRYHCHPMHVSARFQTDYCTRNLFDNYEKNESHYRLITLLLLRARMKRDRRLLADDNCSACVAGGLLIWCTLRVGAIDRPTNGC